MLERPSSTAASSVIPGPWRMGEVEIDPAARRLTRAGHELAIGNRAFDLLVVLAGGGGRILSSDELRAAVWPQADVAENNLRVQITHLRKLLGPEAIEYRPRQGYRLAWAVQATDAATAEAVAEGSPPVHAPEPAVLVLGRDALLTELQAQLRPGQRITLQGPGGSGKTLLAQAALQRAAAAFADGVWWVDLAALAETGAVAAAVAAALQLPPGPDADGRLASHLAGRRLLLVLDNCEHLVSAATALADALVRAAPDVAVLATSRVPLKCAGEQLLPVGVLDLPADATLAAARSSGALAVFEARVHALDPRFRLDEGNVATAVEVCRRLDGLPFAIAVAAAHVPSLGLATVRARLDDRLHWRAAVSDAAPDHQASLQDTLDWSHGLLAEPAQRLLQCAGVFAGGFTLDDLRAVLAGPALSEPQLQRAVRGLVEHGLLLLDGGALRGSVAASRQALHDHADYHLHESVRLYARSRLADSAHADAAHAAHARCMLGHLQALVKRPVADRIASPALLAEADRALAWSIAHDPVLAMLLCKACNLSWRRLGWHERAWHHVRLLLAQPVTADDRLARVDVILGMCGIEFERDHLTETVALARDALALLRPDEVEDTRSGLAHSWIANVAAMRGQWPEAEAGFRADLAAAQRSGNLGAQQDSLNNLGWVLQAAGRPDEGRPFLHQALALPHDDDWGRMVAHENLGELEAGVGDSQQAVYHLECVIVLARRLPDAYRLANAQALMALACGDEQLAGPVPAWLRECLEIARRQGFLRLVAYVCIGLARNRLAGQQPAEALALLHAAQAVLARGRLDATPLMARSMVALRQRAEAALAPHAQAAARARGELLTVDEIAALASAE